LKIADLEGNCRRNDNLGRDFPLESVRQSF
jgi:hypothetical protein